MAGERWVVRPRRVRRAALLLVRLAPLVVLGGCAPRLTVPPPPVPLLLFPLAADSVRFTSGWGDARPGGRLHRGQDLFCARWTPILAVVSGVVDWVARDRPRPGRSYSILLRGDDGNLYFYDHLNNDNPGTRDDAGGPRYAYARGLRNGDRVTAGDVIGYVGDSGNADRAGPHLHFEIHRGKWGDAIDAAPALRAAWQRRCVAPAARCAKG